MSDRPHTIVRWSDPAAPRTRLLCIPHAGAGASRFRAWPTQLPPDVAVWAVSLPGRERRLGEPPHRRMDDAVNELVTALADAPVDSLALFGHCSGALIAASLARALQARGAGAVQHVVLAAQAGPASLRRARAAGGRTRESPTSLIRAALGDDADPALVALLAPAVEADLALEDDFDLGDRRSLHAPVTVIVGDDDSLSAEAAGTWRHETSAAFAIERVAGDRLLASSWAELPGLVASALRLGGDGRR